MYLMLHQLFDSSSLTKNAIDFILPKLIKVFQKNFSVFADCGAGVGYTSGQYRDFLYQNLHESCISEAQVYCYEPLPENYSVIIKKLGGDSIFKLRNVAVSNDCSKAKFSVPCRMHGNASDWSEGTSYGGKLDNTVSSGDFIEVPTVRLEDEIDGCFDFIKLDLQGGEYKALVGLGQKISQVKLFQVEFQLLWDDMSADYLRQSGFITFFDRLQFGLNTNILEVPFKQLSEIGLVVDRVKVPDGYGIPLIFWGHFSKYNGIIDEVTLSLRSEKRDALKKIGVNYMQTDILSFNASIFPTVSHLLSDFENL